MVGCPLKRREKTRPLFEGHYRVPSLARDVAQRVHVAEHTLRRHRVPPNVQDELAYPATVP